MQNAVELCRWRKIQAPIQDLAQPVQKPIYAQPHKWSYVLKSNQDIIMSVHRRSFNDFVAEFRIQEQHPLLLKNHRRMLRLSRENINLAELDAELWALKVRLKRFI